MKDSPWCIKMMQVLIHLSCKSDLQIIRLCTKEVQLEGRGLIKIIGEELTRQATEQEDN